MRFEWDASKDSTNLKKHGIPFASVVSVFMDPNALTIYDEGHSDDDEDRWITIGRSLAGIVYVISHTYRKQKEDAAIRIISARKADKDEEMQYYSL